MKPFSAWAIIYGGKDVENRSRRTNFRGRLLIHASNYRSRDELEDDAAHVRERCPSMPDEVEAGAIIGSVEVYDAWLGAAFVNRWASRSGWHWMLRNPRPLPVWECKGSLGIWTLKG